MTTRTQPSDPVVVAPGSAVRGRARPAAPLRREGPEKLTGTALYTDDIVVPGAWYGATIRSTDARATFVALDLDPAFDWSKVVVVTAADIPGENIVNSIKSDQPILVPLGGEIRHHAEPLALLAAPDRSTLREARRRARPRTEPLPPVFDPEASDHTFAAYHIETGEVDAALAAADVVLEGEYRVGHQEQLYIENNAMIAVPTEGGGVTVTGSLQCPYYLHGALRRGLGLGAEAARVVQAETGGGFGGKEEYPSVIGLHAALLARKAQRPVRMIYERHEDIAATTKRHPAIVRHRTGVSHDGRLIAQDIEVVMDGGAYCTLTPVVLSRGALHSGGPYRCPNVRIRARATRTNTPPNGAFRGFGAPQVEFAAETHLNRIADELGLSPLEIRRRNVYRSGDTTPTGQVLRESVAGEEVLERAAEASEFARLRARTDDARRRRAGSGAVPASALRTGRDRVAAGIGLALAWHGAGFTGSGEVKLASVASLELTAEGAIRILTASTEMGQGTKTILPQLVADTLEVPEDQVEIAPQDTAFVPDSGPTVASRTAMVVGGLLIKAARTSRARPAPRSRPATRRTRASTVPCASTRASSRTRASRSTMRRTGATPIQPSAGPPVSPTWRSTSTRARSMSATWSRPMTSVGSSTRSSPRARSRVARSRPSATRRSRRSSCGTAATSTTGWRPTSSRPRSMRRGSARSSSRPRSASRPTVRRVSASCRWTSARRPWSQRSRTRPAPGSRSCRRVPSGSWPR
jgi:CO/xanthine dehydrogenase Mo-binding subunit